MVEKLDNEETRKKIAEQIRTGRSYDRANQYPTERDKEQYRDCLGGYDATVSYVKTLPIRKWLDIGAGQTVGINEIADDITQDGFEVKSTVLYRGKEVQNHLGFKNTYITPIETLKRIPDKSFSLITSVYSAVYSKSPEMAIRSIDRVLIPGGVFQGTFEDPVNANRDFPLNPPDEFEREFRNKGYDTVVGKNAGKIERDLVLLAIKPDAAISAHELLQKNRQSLPPPLTQEQLITQMMVKMGYNNAVNILKPTASLQEIKNYVLGSMVEEYGFTNEEAEIIIQKLHIRNNKYIKIK